MSALTRLKKNFVHINDLDFKTLYFFSGEFLICLSLWAVKEKQLGREEDKLGIRPPSVNLMGLLRAFLAYVTGSFKCRSCKLESQMGFDIYMHFSCCQGWYLDTWSHFYDLLYTLTSMYHVYGDPPSRIGSRFKTSGVAEEKDIV